MNDREYLDMDRQESSELIRDIDNIRALLITQRNSFRCESRPFVAIEVSCYHYRRIPDLLILRYQRYCHRDLGYTEAVKCQIKSKKGLAAIISGI
jgi:hypothetical protein